MGPPHEGSIRRTLLPRSYISLSRYLRGALPYVRGSVVAVTGVSVEISLPNRIGKRQRQRQIPPATLAELGDALKSLVD